VGRGPTAVAVAERSDHIFVGNSKADTVSMLDARTGAVLRTARMDHSPRAVAVDDRTGRVVVLSRGIDDAYVPPMGRSGTVSALEARTGTVLHAVAVGVGPRASAVDERRGRVCVAARRPR
jgi:YVTN family beta-propeller protein